MKTLTILTFIGLCLVLHPSNADVGAAETPSKPNIVLIFVDDLGYGDLGCYGQKQIKTPNIDQLARDGQRWTSFYAAGNFCVPSRKGLMSGRHPALLKRQPLASDRDALLPAMLKRNGYATAILGKWHLAGYPKDFTQSPMHPLECGFDDHFGTPGSNDAPGPPLQTREAFDKATPSTWKIPLIRGREVVEVPAKQDLFTKRYTEEAVRWIARKKDQPFFLYLAHNMPHAPVFASDSFQGRSQGGRFGDVVEEIDWSVGTVRQAIRDAGIEEQTLIIFTSDNGPWTVFGPHGGTAHPLRGEKSTTWEGGSRVPAIFAWPGTIQPSVVDGIGVNLDLYATFAALIGDDDLPTNKPGWMSTDLSGTLLSGQPSARKSWYYGPAAYRSGKYKIIRRTNPPTDPITRKKRKGTFHDPPLLFDLESDIGEQNNLAEQHPDVVKRLTDDADAIANR